MSAERFAALADVLVPASATMPSASAADPAGFWTERVLAARPDLRGQVDAAVAATAGMDAADAVAALRADAPERYTSLLFVVQMAYYMNPRIRRLIGYPGQVAAPQLPDEADVYLEEADVSAVVARGPIYKLASSE